MISEGISVAVAFSIKFSPQKSMVGIGTVYFCIFIFYTHRQLNFLQKVVLDFGGQVNEADKIFF